MFQGDDNNESQFEEILDADSDTQFQDDSHLDEQENHGQHIYEFVTVPSFVAVVSYNSCEPIYIIKINEKGVAKEPMKDRYGHSINPGELYLKGNYLKAERSRNIAKRKFSIIQAEVICDPEEIFEVFVDIDREDLTMTKDSYLALVSRAT